MTRRLTHSILVADSLVLALALFSGYWLRYHPEPVSFGRFIGVWWPVLASAVLLWAGLYFHMRLDGFRGGWHFPTVLSQLTLALILLNVLMFAVGYVGRQYYSRLVLLYFGVLTLLGLIAVRCCIRLLLISRTRAGATRRVVIVGTGNVALELARKIKRHPELMLEVVGFLSPGATDAGNHLDGGAPPRGEQPQSVTSLGALELFRSSHVDELIVALPDISATETKKLVALCRQQGFRVSLVPQWYELYLSKARLLELDGLPMVSLENHSPSGVSFLFKRVIDVVGALVLLLLSLPFLVLVCAVLLVQRGKALTWEVRCGRDGKPFRMYRLPIDREHPERLVGFDRLLAHLSLTELPQLWNVLLGDMALVGPRPERLDRVRHYSDWQKQRLNVRPGLTGLAQVYGLRDQHSSEEKARFDLEYIYRWSPFLDLSLVLQTVWTLAVRFWRPAPAMATAAPIMTVSSSVEDPREVMHANRAHSSAN